MPGEETDGNSKNSGNGHSYSSPIRKAPDHVETHPKEGIQEDNLEDVVDVTFVFEGTDGDKGRTTPAHKDHVTVTKAAACHLGTMDDQRTAMADSRPLMATREDDEVYNTTEHTNTNQEPSSRFYLPCRFVIMGMMTGGFFTAFAQRMGFNIALVAMVNFTEPAENITSDYCPASPLPANTTSAKQEGEFNWDANHHALVLGAFYYGYTVSQLPFGYLAERFGGKATFAFTGLSTGILSLLIPTVARWSPYALIVLRAVQGFCQGSIYPTSLVLMSRWVPPVEQTRMYSIVNSGSTIGSMISMAVSGVLCDSTFLGGWPSTFYLFGGLSIVWTIGWLLLAYDTPAVHPYISQDEKEYIAKETKNLGSVKYSNPPWCSIIKSIPVWAIFIVICTDNFCYYVAFSCMPVYMKQVLRFDISQNGLMSSLPSLIQLPLSLTIGVLADFIRKREILQVINIRRSATVIGEFLPGVFLLLIGFVGCNKAAAVSLLMLSVGTNSFCLAGQGMSIFDIAPMYAGSLMGILNGIGNMFGFITPLYVANITNNSGDLAKWQKVFCISGAIYMFGAIVYCLLITDKEEKWAKDKRNIKKQENPDTSTIKPREISI